MPEVGREGIPGAALTWLTASGAGGQQGAAQTESRDDEQQPPRPHCPKARRGRAALLGETVPASARLGLRARRGRPPGPAAERCALAGRAPAAGVREEARRGPARRRVGWRSEGAGGGARAGRGGSRAEPEGKGVPPRRLRLHAVVGPLSSPVPQPRLSRLRSCETLSPSCTARLPPAAAPRPGPLATLWRGTPNETFFPPGSFDPLIINDSVWRKPCNRAAGLGGCPLHLSLTSGGAKICAVVLRSGMRPRAPVPAVRPGPPCLHAKHRTAGRALRPIWKFGI